MRILRQGLAAGPLTSCFDYDHNRAESPSCRLAFVLRHKAPVPGFTVKSEGHVPFDQVVRNGIGTSNFGRSEIDFVLQWSMKNGVPRYEMCDVAGQTLVRALAKNGHPVLFADPGSSERILSSSENAGDDDVGGPRGTANCMQGNGEPDWGLVRDLNILGRNHADGELSLSAFVASVKERLAAVE